MFVHHPWDLPDEPDVAPCFWDSDSDLDEEAKSPTRESASADFADMLINMQKRMRLVHETYVFLRVLPSGRAYKGVRAISHSGRLHRPAIFSGT